MSRRSENLRAAGKRLKPETAAARLGGSNDGNGELAAASPNAELSESAAGCSLVVCGLRLYGDASSGVQGHVGTGAFKLGNHLDAPP